MSFTNGITIIIVISTILGGVIRLFIQIMKENNTMTNRIKSLSENLQLAEHMTGDPYYTSINESRMSCEKSDWLYDSMRARLFKKYNDERIGADGVLT